jgi:peptidoglycan/xylan/chitin deacetylase (PgdA/CDA1 family)
MSLSRRLAATCLALSLIQGCSSAPLRRASPAREPASEMLLRSAAVARDFSVALEDPQAGAAYLQLQTRQLYHVYVHGLVLRDDFDHLLEDPRTAASVLSSPTYAKLLAAHSVAMELESRLSDHYQHVVLAAADTRADPSVQEAARTLSEVMRNALKGQLEEGGRIPEPLHPMVLSNWLDTQAFVAQQLQATLERKDLALRYPGAKQQLQQDLNGYLDQQRRLAKGVTNPFQRLMLAKAVQEESRREDYQEMGSRLAEMGAEHLQAVDELKRDPSSNAVLYPSVGGAGNVTGNCYPANTWSFTFDDGPHITHSREVLANLISRKLKATFFELAGNVGAKELTPIALAIRDSGMDMASHSWNHKNLTSSVNLPSDVVLNHEIAEAKARTEALLDRKIRLYRLPYGNGVNNPRVRGKIAEAGMIHVYWNVDTLDWSDKNPDSVAARAMKQINARGKGVILFHDVHPQSVAASAKVMDILIQKGVRLKTVQEVVDEINTAGKESCS